MIQRIQSLYLLLITALLGGTLFSPLGVFFRETQAYAFMPFRLEQVVGIGLENIPIWALGSILAICALIAFVTIFLFKNRVLQTRLCIFNFIALIGFYIAYVAFMLMIKKALGADYGWNLSSALPLVAIILDFLAIRGIIKDEKKVRRYSRIR